jgi:hypothetical protein
MRTRHDPVSTPMQQAPGRVLLTGATGYVGGRLLRKLEESGRPVRCMVRSPEALSERTAEQTEIVHGDVLGPESLPREVTPANELRGSGRPEVHPNSPLELVAPGRSVRGKAALRSPA